VFQTWRELHSTLADVLANVKSVAMEYSPSNAIPYVARVDAGTVELIRSFGVNVVSSAPLSQALSSTLDESEKVSHREAGRRLMAAKDVLFAELSDALRNGRVHDEHTIQQRFIVLMQQEGLAVEDPPAIALNANASNPHYEPAATGSAQLKRGDLLLADFWAPLLGEKSIYADYTWMAFAGTRQEIPTKMREVFGVAVAARDAGIALMQQRRSADQSVTGAEVDDLVRGVVDDAGYGPFFVHRTGHSITTHVHGNGANLDNFETNDERELLPNTCNSVEPGIYLPEFGVRTETNTLIHRDHAEVTGGQLQHEITPLL